MNCGQPTMRARPLGIDPNAPCPEFLPTSQFCDRETFDFTDPENYRRVDNDVWVFALGS